MIRKYAFVVAMTALLMTGCKKSAEDHLKAADQFFKDKKYADASLNYRNAIKQDARLGEAYYGLGLSELEQGNAQLGFDAIRQAAELLPARMDVKVRLADLFLAAYQQEPENGALYEALRKVVGEITVADKNSFDALRMNGNLALLDRKAAEAISYYKEANKLRPLYEYLVIGYAQALIDNGQPEEAEKLGRELIDQKKDFGPIYDLLYKSAMARKQVPAAEEILREKARNLPGNADAAIQLSAHYLRVGNPNAASATLQAVLDQKPPVGKAHLSIGQFYVRMGDLDRAASVFELGQQVSKADLNSLQTQLARVRSLQNRPDEALKILEQVLSREPNDNDALMIKAGILLDQGKKSNLESVIAIYNSVLKRRPADADAATNLGRAYLMKGDLAQARRHLQESAKMAPTERGAKLLLATVNILDRKSGDALNPLNEVLGTEPKDATAQFLKFAALMEDQRFSDAKPLIDEMVRANPGSRDLRAQQGLLAIAMRRYSEAEAVFNRLAAESKDAKSAAGLAETYVAQRQFDRALRILGEETARNPNSSALRRMLGKAAIQAGRFDLAVENFQNLLSQNPKDASLAVELGNALREQGEYKRAAEELTRAISLNPKNAAAHLVLGMTHYSAGNSVESVKAYRQVLALQPANPAALNNLAFGLAESGKEAELAEALILAQRAVTAVPNEADFRDTLGWVFLKRKNPDSALQVFQALTKEKPDHPSYQHHLGLAYLAKDDTAGARRALEAALRNRPTESEAQAIRNLLNRLGVR